jgi:hypothetical protein
MLLFWFYIDSYFVIIENNTTSIHSFFCKEPFLFSYNYTTPEGQADNINQNISSYEWLNNINEDVDSDKKPGWDVRLEAEKFKLILSLSHVCFVNLVKLFNFSGPLLLWQYNEGKNICFTWFFSGLNMIMHVNT